MARGKLKILYLIRIFQEETDDEHALSLQDIIARLAACGVQVERKTLYDDFAELRQFGFDIISESVGRNTYYHLGARNFELPELKLLVDAVQSSRFITDRKSRELIRKLEGQASAHQARQLQRQVYIAGRVKSMNESIYYNVDKLHEAINTDSQIRFQYFRWNAKKEMELRKGGGWYAASPWALTWNDENYYLVAYDAEDGIIKHFRVDKMLRIRLSKDRREGRDHFLAFDMARYTRSHFGMFTGEETAVTLEGDSDLVNVVVDRFGRDIPLVPLGEDRFEAKVNVVVSPQFFGWAMALAAGLKVTGPEPVVRQLRERLALLSEEYGGNRADQG